MSTIAVKIILDTNVFIAIIGKTSPLRWIFDAILSGRFTLCISNDILFEYQEVLQEKTHPEIAENITNFLSVYPFVQQTTIFFNWHLIREDKDDNKFADCAIAAGAYCLVSNDGHFKPYKNLDFPPLRVLTVQEFEAQFKEV